MSLRSGCLEGSDSVVLPRIVSIEFSYTFESAKTFDDNKHVTIIDGKHATAY